MANTENIEAKLCAYIDGDLDAAGRAEIEKHLAANPQHRGLIAQLSKQRDLLRELPRESAPEEIIDALQSQMERSVLLGDADAGAETAAMKIHRWPQLLAAAAIVTLTVGLGAVIYFVLPRTTDTEDYARVAAPGATLDDAATLDGATPRSATRLTEPDADDVIGEAGDRAAGARANSAARAETNITASAGPQNEPLPSIAMAPAPQGIAADALAKDMPAPDVFAPARDAAERESTLARNDLVDAQYRLQNADLARQLKESPGGLQDNAMFVVVSTADPSAARSEVTNYLASNKIAWDSVSHPFPEPLAPAANQEVNLSRSQNLNVQMKQAPTQPGQQISPQARLVKTESKDGATGGAVTDAQATPPAPTAQTQPSDSIPLDKDPGMAGAASTLGEPFELRSTVTQSDAGLQPATTQPASKLQQAVQPTMPLQTATASRLIIARGMTKQQATELSTNLAKQTTVQRAAVYEPRPLPASAAPQLRIRALRDGENATTGPAISTTAPFTVPDDPAAGPATVPATISLDDRGGLLSSRTATTQETVVPTTLESAVSLTLETTEAASPDEPSTQPLNISDERVDVVILVENDILPASLGEALQTPLDPQSNIVPATNPTTIESLSPSTKPSLDSTP